MVEKELKAAPSLGNCFYALHLQCLLKCQREELLKEESVKIEIDAKEFEDGGGGFEDGWKMEDSAVGSFFGGSESITDGDGLS